MVLPLQLRPVSDMRLQDLTTLISPVCFMGRKTTTHVIDPIHHGLPVLAPFLRLIAGQFPRDVLDDNPHKVVLRLASDIKTVLVHVDEDDVNVKCWQADARVVRREVFGERAPLRRREGLGVGEDPPERHSGTGQSEEEPR